MNSRILYLAYVTNDFSDPLIRKAIDTEYTELTNLYIRNRDKFLNLAFNVNFDIRLLAYLYTSINLNLEKESYREKLSVIYFIEKIIKLISKSKKHPGVKDLVKEALGKHRINSFKGTIILYKSSRLSIALKDRELILRVYDHNLAVYKEYSVALEKIFPSYFQL